jgi:RNA polymerase sigma factor (sigma-70 family)
MKTPEQYMKLCKKLASKYKSPWWQDDLVSEGLVAIYEELDKNPNSNRVGQVAKDAMWDYANLKTKPVTVPNTEEAHIILRGDSDWMEKHSSYDEKTIAWLTLVLKGSHEGIGDRQIPVDGYDSEAVTKELVDKLFELAEDVLQGRQLELFTLYYKEGLTQADLAYTYKLSQAGVAQNLQKSCEIVRKAYMNERLKV